MIVLREQETEQLLNVCIDGENANNIVLIDEETNIETNIDIEFYINKYYHSASLVLPIKEEKYYTLLVKYNDEIVHRNMIFCTNQEIENYSINKDAYVENTTTNEYKVYE